MEIIKRFKIKPGTTMEDLRRAGVKPGKAAFIREDCTMLIWKELPGVSDITVNIGFPEDLSTWNDLNCVDVIDEDFGQPYIPFYTYLDNPDKNKSEFVQKVVRGYNAFLSLLPFLEERQPTKPDKDRECELYEN